jgi:hypothetical protein
MFLFRKVRDRVAATFDSLVALSAVFGGPGAWVFDLAV